VINVVNGRVRAQLSLVDNDFVGPSDYKIICTGAVSIITD
jgi:hypothetical protein